MGGGKSSENRMTRSSVTSTSRALVNRPYLKECGRQGSTENRMTRSSVSNTEEVLCIDKQPRY